MSAPCRFNEGTPPDEMPAWCQSAARLALVAAKTASMVRAWDALASSAAEAGHRHISPFIWEARLADGTVAAFVETTADASRVIADGRYLKVYTLAEVANLLDATPDAFRPPPVVKSKPLPPSANALAPGSKLKPFAERGRFECAFPIGDGEAMRACCCDYEPGRRRPYCDFHLGLTTDVERVSA